MGTEYVILNIGQSNAEPCGSLTTYVGLVPEMNYAANTPDTAVSLWYGKGVETIRFLTFYNPEAAFNGYPVGYPPAPFDATNFPGGTAADILRANKSYCYFLPWTSLEGALNPNLVGFRYPNAFSVHAGPLGAAYPGKFSIAVDLGRRMHGHLKKRVNVITVAVGGTSLQHTETPLPYISWGWFDKRIHTNWSPADDNGLAARLLVVLDAAKLAAEAEGNTLEVILVAMMQGETDSIFQFMRALWPTNTVAFVAWVRQAIYDRGLTSVAPQQIPFIWPEIPDVPWGVSNAAEINVPLRQMHQDDPFFATFSTNDTTRFSKNVGDNPHYDTVGTMSMAEDIMESWLDISGRAAMSFPDAGTVTLGQLRTLVLQVTERNTTDSGQSVDVVNQAINDAYMELIQLVGDTAYWLRQVMTLTLNSRPTLEVEMPRVVARVLEIRPAAYPLLTYDFTMTGHSDRGRVKIATLDWVSESVYLHYIYEPAPMVADGERVLLPAGYIEAVKIGAAKRIAESTSNVPLKIQLRSDAEKLKNQVAMHAQKTDRQRRQKLTGGRARSRYGGARPRGDWRLA
jgi:hypothetical protein